MKFKTKTYISILWILAVIATSIIGIFFALTSIYNLISDPLSNLNLIPSLIFGIFIIWLVWFLWQSSRKYLLTLIINENVDFQIKYLIGQKRVDFNKNEILGFSKSFWKGGFNNLSQNVIIIYLSGNRNIEFYDQLIYNYKELENSLLEIGIKYLGEEEFNSNGFGRIKQYKYNTGHNNR